MNRHPTMEELQDYQEGLLAPESRDAVRAHLLECPSCRNELEAVSRLLSELGELPQEAEPSRDLWPQIQWRIQGAGVPEARPAPRKGITLRAWQLMAAGIALILFSGGMVWAFMSGYTGGPIRDMAGAGEGSQPAVYAAEFAAFQEYTDAFKELERVLEEGKDVLDPETIQVLEENLMVIDEAIQESTLALAQDPGSRILRRLLTETMRRKVDLLQQAAEIILTNT